ncbi:hypothetical protein MUCCIDRAFT_107263 [Mucor lusitanicus CBS 277.49]|uniref:Uncharacterized protein n=1 Tax=Mucor lusitanicus CBS 277.49 TaxID=747725 RepID=A0A162QYD5_MUCCL|nr:hypothetical protein MUCCIDRAFT_107263 [Mucor lusitanicus CBS 277.49]
MRDTDAKQFLHATFARVMDDHDITKALFLLKQILTGGDTAQEAVAAERRLGYIGEPAVQTAMHMILDDHFSQYDRDQLPVIGNTVSLRLYQLIGERIHLQQYVEPINYTRHDVWVSAAVCRDKEEESVLTSIWAEDFILLVNQDIISNANILLVP